MGLPRLRVTCAHRGVAGHPATAVEAATLAEEAPVADVIAESCAGAARVLRATRMEGAITLISQSASGRRLAYKAAMSAFGR